eukprot:399171-Hanusia_phi.AAC.1
MLLQVSCPALRCALTPQQHVDPSLTFGFYVKDEADLSDLCDRLTTMNQALGGYPAISVAEKKSVPAADLNFDETEDDDGVILI